MIEPIFNMFKVKFTVMDRLKILNPDSKKVIVFINLETIMKVLLNSKVNNFLKARGNKNHTKIELMSCIINLAMHYKLYFEKYRIDNRVILYWNYPKGEYYNSKFIEEYRKYHEHKFYGNINCDYILTCIDESYNFLKTLCGYIDQTYLIDSDTIESSVIPYIMQKDLYSQQGIDDVQYIIISNSKYEYQYVNKGFTILEPKGEQSIFVTKDNALDILKDKNNIKNTEEIPLNLLSFTFSLLGDKYRSIPKMNGVGLSHVINIVNKAIKSLLITENTTNIDILVNNIIKEEYREQFIKNYNCIDLDRQYDKLTDLDTDVILKQIVDKFDDNNLLKINEKYFKSCPLMLLDSRRRRVFGKDYKKSVFDR